MSAENGKKLFTKICGTCHTSEKGGSHKNGPNLFGVYGRKSGSASGYSYSAVFKSKDITWSSAQLKEYLENPKKYIPGTKMTLNGVKKESDRMDLIAFLQKLK